MSQQQVSAAKNQCGQAVSNERFAGMSKVLKLWGVKFSAVPTLEFEGIVVKIFDSTNNQFSLFSDPQPGDRWVALGANGAGQLHVIVREKDCGDRALAQRGDFVRLKLTDDGSGGERWCIPSQAPESSRLPSREHGSETMDNSTQFLVIGARQAGQKVSGNKLVLVKADGCVQLFEKAVAVLEPFAKAVSYSAETVMICFPGATADVSRGGRVIDVDSDTDLLRLKDWVNVNSGRKFVALPGAVVKDTCRDSRRVIEKIKTENGLVRICLGTVGEHQILHN